MLFLAESSIVLLLIKINIHVWGTTFTFFLVLFLVYFFLFGFLFNPTPPMEKYKVCLSKEHYYLQKSCAPNYIIILVLPYKLILKLKLITAATNTSISNFRNSIVERKVLYLPFNLPPFSS